MLTLRIITYESPGLLNDAKIYKNIFRLHHFKVSILALGQFEKKQESVDVNLFLETIGFIKSGNVKDIFPSKVNIFMPNHELFFYYDKLKYIDYVLCKTNIAFKMFEYIKEEQSHHYQCIYTNFTTFIPKEWRVNHKYVKKDPNLFVHLAGKSPFKNTDILVYVWIKNNGFLDVDPNIKLVITCYKTCYQRLNKYLRSYYGHILPESNNTNQIQAYQNLTIYLSPAPESIYKNLLHESNVAICISKAEGFGHYINEARYFGTYVITIDYPPMNELVGTNNGMLIKNFSTSTRDMSKFTSYQFHYVYPDPEELRDKIIYCIKNKKLISEHTWSYRKRFFKDLNFFEETMNHFIANQLLLKIK